MSRVYDDRYSKKANRGLFGKCYDDYNDDCCHDRHYPCCKPGPPGPPGADGEVMTIKGSYDRLCDLIINHPIGKKTEAYLVGGDLYVWNEKLGKYGKWEKVGNLQGPCKPFLSSYLETMGNTQTVAADSDIVFDIDDEVVDAVGGYITVNRTGTEFTINRSGLYLVEWSVNISSSAAVSTIGILENGYATSGLSNSAMIGSHSSGALISVSEDEIPFTISLHNFGGPISLDNPAALQNTAASIRILRFADGPVS